MGGNNLNTKISTVSDMIIESRKLVVFTGAGISTESGIPDFRGPGGIWSRFDPDDFTIEKFLQSPETREKQWRILIESGLIVNAEPNSAHLSIAELEKLNKLECVITQNIDNLHQEAGNSAEKVIELHGNMNFVVCTGCHERYPMEDIVERLKKEAGVPDCEKCQGILKPDVVFFGEALPEEALQKATFHSSTCDLLIAIGSSLAVFPAAYMPLYAKQGGAKLAIINIGSTLYDSRADILIDAKAGETMESILKNVKGKL
jgi:NAD-dependent deacetylase